MMDHEKKPQSVAQINIKIFYSQTTPHFEVRRKETPPPMSILSSIGSPPLLYEEDWRKTVISRL